MRRPSRVPRDFPRGMVSEASAIHVARGIEHDPPERAIEDERAARPLGEHAAGAEYGGIGDGALALRERPHDAPLEHEVCGCEDDGHGCRSCRRRSIRVVHSSGPLECPQCMLRPDDNPANSAGTPDEHASTGHEAIRPRTRQRPRAVGGVAFTVSSEEKLRCPPFAGRAGRRGCAVRPDPERAGDNIIGGFAARCEQRADNNSLPKATHSEATHPGRVFRRGVGRTARIGGGSRTARPACAVCSRASAGPNMGARANAQETFPNAPGASGTESVR